MSTNIGAGFSETILASLRDMQSEAKKLSGSAKQESKDAGGMSFTDHLKQGIQEVNAKQVVSDKMSMELSTGKTGNIHETMLAATQAELSFNLMVQIRNKALEAYGEIMRMPV
jgi:flagellar hook-basal body complex protein FliE